LYLGAIGAAAMYSATQGILQGQIVLSKQTQSGHTTPWSQMSKAEQNAFKHSYSRHHKELGLPNFRESQAAHYQTLFNNKVTMLRNEGMGGFFESMELVHGRLQKVYRTEPIINGKRYYFYETVEGQFISAGQIP
jgi:hypothetical protein